MRNIETALSARKRLAAFGTNQAVAYQLWLAVLSPLSTALAAWHGLERTQGLGLR